MATNILVFPMPLHSHTVPLMHLLQRIASPTVISTLLVPEADLLKIQHFIISDKYVRAVGIPAALIDVDVTRSMPGLDLNQMVGILMGQVTNATNGILELVHGLIEDSEGDWKTPFSCFLSDMLIPNAQDLADKLNIPRIGFWVSSALSFLLFQSVSSLMSQKIFPLSEDSDEDVRIEFFSGQTTPISSKHLPASFSCLDVCLELSTIFGRTKEAACVLINSGKEIESLVMKHLESLAEHTKFVAVGPLLPTWLLDGKKDNGSSSPWIWNEDARCLSWLDDESHLASSVLYVSFGSMAKLSALQVENIALGLEFSKQPFLWVIRPNLVEGLSPGFYENFLKRTRNQGLIVSWSPQLEVLAHKSVGGFMTQCGWNSVQEAAWFGVPMICWPCFAEQATTCSIIVDDWKTGLRLSTNLGGLMSSKEIQKVIKLLMVDDQGREIRKNAIELAGLVKSGSKMSDEFTFM